MPTYRNATVSVSGGTGKRRGIKINGKQVPLTPEGISRAARDGADKTVVRDALRKAFRQS